VALYEAALLFGTLVAETILASVQARAHKQAGHMDASDLIKALQKHLARRGPSTYGYKESGLLDRVRMDGTMPVAVVNFQIYMATFETDFGRILRVFKRLK
jgi:ABC-type transport system involved in cytochrome bd biosynthesis fused ATPase/permease subunit